MAAGRQDDGTERRQQQENVILLRRALRALEITIGQQRRGKGRGKDEPDVEARVAIED